MVMNEKIQQLIDAGAVFFINHSAGKDSQAMYALLSQIIPGNQIEVIHAHLPGVEWEGTIEHIRQTVTQPVWVCQASKTFLEMVAGRGYWPAPKYRQCTSDLKRGPLEKLIRKLMQERGSKLAVNCTGIRAQESKNRAGIQPFKIHKELSKAGRTVYDWLPIHNLSTEEVFATIRNAGQEPHFAYSLGMSRLSCCFCIMARKEDLAIAAKHNPEVFLKISMLEKQINQTFVMPAEGKERQFLPEFIASFKPKEKQLSIF